METEKIEPKVINRTKPELNKKAISLMKDLIPLNLKYHFEQPYVIDGIYFETDEYILSSSWIRRIIALNMKFFVGCRPLAKGKIIVFIYTNGETF